MIKHNLIKNLLILVLILTLLPLNNTTTKAAEVGQYVQNAQTLQALGLFKGTSKGFELTKVSTRAEAAVMLVRLLGAENLALEGNGNFQHPFLDVPTWAKPYIAYLYSKGLTKGMTTTKYGSNVNVTANQYSTMLLRSLGYNDGDGLYKWDHALEFAKSVGLIEGQEFDALAPMANKNLLRDQMARLSYKCLFTDKMNTETSLLASLVDNQVITSNKLQDAMKIDTNLAQFLNNTQIPSQDSEMRAVWITYIELQGLLKNATADDFQTSIRTTFEKIKSLDLNTVIVQVRPFGDALYSSDYFPWSYVVTGKEGVTPEFDPLEIMVEEAHQQGLKIEAWINPYRVRTAGLKLGLSEQNPAASWLKDGSNRVIQLADVGTFYNPASSDVRTLITNGVSEIVKKYAVDGIHFDDYFYPSKDLTYDASDYNQYKIEGGLLTQADWRRENVNLLVKAVYSEIKNLNPQVQFGVSPQGSFEANYDQQFIDVEKWLSTSEYLDYICPQMYYGFSNFKYPYENTVKQWDKLITSDTIKLYVGIAPYKIGREDSWAGTSGKLEWMNSTNILQRMVLVARETSHYGGFALYRYAYLYDQDEPYKTQISEELKALKEILIQ